MKSATFATAATKQWTNFPLDATTADTDSNRTATSIEEQQTVQYQTEPIAYISQGPSFASEILTIELQHRGVTGSNWRAMCRRVRHAHNSLWLTRRRNTLKATNKLNKLYLHRLGCHAAVVAARGGTHSQIQIYASPSQQ